MVVGLELPKRPPEDAGAVAPWEVVVVEVEEPKEKPGVEEPKREVVGAGLAESVEEVVDVDVLGLEVNMVGVVVGFYRGWRVM